MRTVTTEASILLNELLVNLNNSISNPEFKKWDLLSLYPILEALKNSEDKEAALLHTQSGNAENNLCRLLELFFSAIEKNKSDIVDFILNVILSKDYFLLKTEWVSAHSFALKKCFNALRIAVIDEDDETLVAIINITDKHVLAKMDKLALYNFLHSQSQQNENQTHWFDIINMLYLASKENYECGFANLESILLSCISKLDKIALTQLLFEKITTGIFEGKNTLYVLLRTLEFVRAENSTAINRTIMLIQLCLDKYDAKANELATTLAARDSVDSCNRLHGLIIGLIVAILHKNEKTITSFIKFIQYCVDKCSVHPTVFRAALSDKIIAGDVAGKNALRALSLALFYAAFHNLQKEIDSICTLMHSCIEKYFDHKALVAASTATDSNRWNIWFSLIAAFECAVYEKNDTAVVSITKLIHAFLEKYRDDNDIATLIAALAEKQSGGKYIGTNALYWLTYAIYFAIKNERNKTAFECSATLFLILLNKFKDSPKILAQALAAKKTSGSVAGKNALFALLDALNYAVFRKYDAEIKSIINLVHVCLSAYKTDPSALVEILNEKATAGSDEGKNAWQLLGNALRDAVSTNNSDAIINLSTIMQFCMTQCDTLSSDAGLGLIGLIKALNEVEISCKNNKESQASIFACILDALSKIKPENLQEQSKSKIFEKRDSLTAYFKETYFTQKVKQVGIAAVEAMCGRDTLLGQLIDHRSSRFSFGDTGTRGFVTDFIHHEKEKMARVTQDILSTKQLLDKTIAEKNKILIEINHTAFECVLNTAAAMCDSNKILNYTIEGKTIAELRERYIIAVKNLFVELALPAATTAQPVIGRVVSNINAPRFFPVAQNSAPAAAAAASNFDDILRAIQVPSHPIANAASPARASRYAAHDCELDDLEKEALLPS